MARFKETDNAQGQFIDERSECRGRACTYMTERVRTSKGEALYSKGIITSRQIEKACRENITVKALAEGCEPDHGTIAAFISANSEAVQGLFAQILLQCARLKLITGEMFAIDGCKLVQP